jgi:isopenicillin-N epimerase
MITLPLPGDAEAPARGRRDPLQNALWEKHRIEVPIVHWKGRRFVRVSCHLYNREDEIDRLLEALKELTG